MFTKESLQKILNENKDKTFVIKTNEATGHGINGVDYGYYISFRKRYDTSTRFSDSREKNVNTNRITVAAIEDDFIKLDVLNIAERFWNGTLKSATKEHYTCFVPIQSITSIKFVEPDTDVFNGIRMNYEHIDDTCIESRPIRKM